MRTARHDEDRKETATVPAAEPVATDPAKIGRRAARVISPDAATLDGAGWEPEVRPRHDEGGSHP